MKTCGFLRIRKKHIEFCISRGGAKKIVWRGEEVLFTVKKGRVSLFKGVVKI